jgi:two-component system, OmpR family, sensor histidine kinase CiaH
MTRSANIFFIVVFAYIVLALVFWHNSLQKQNVILNTKEIQLYELEKKVNGNASLSLEDIADKTRRKRLQYYGEGGTFLAFIILGAILVYFSFRKRLQLSAQQNNFMLSITHELKSPIAGIKVGLQTMARHNLNETQKQKLLNNSLYETERLNELANNILLSTQLDGKQYVSHKQQFDLIELIKSCVDSFQQRYPNIKWSLHSYADMHTYMGDNTLWRFVFNNLLENAIKYAPESKEIITDVYVSGEYLIIQILDQGKGISALDKKKIFQKFYRAGDEQTRKSKGTGLGLFIVKNAIDIHGGIIEMTDNNPHGNIVNIKIPMNNE